MKKLIIIAAMALMAANAADAKVVTSRTFGERSKTPTEWIIRTGLSLNGASGSAIGDIKDEFKDYDDAECGFGMKPGYELSIAFNRAMGRSGLYWGMELGLGTRGVTFNSKDNRDRDTYYEDGHKSLLTWNVKYSPFTIGYKYSVNDNIRLDLHLGAYASYDFAGTGKSYWDINGEKTDDESEGLGGDELDGFKRFDCGMQVGLGVWYKRFNFDITYQRGFVSAYDDWYNQSMWDVKDNSKIYSNNLMFRVGVAF